MTKLNFQAIPIPGLVLAVVVMVGLSGCDWFCEKCAAPTSCGEETRSVEVEDGDGNVIAFRCDTTAPTYTCGDGTREKDGGGGTVDRDDFECESIRPTTVCGQGTVEQDGGGGTVDRDGGNGPGNLPWPVEKTCIAPV